MTKKEKMYQRIRKHGENLNRIFKTGIEPVKLCKKLRRLEVRASMAGVKYCNGEISSNTWESASDRILDKVKDILGDEVPIFVIGDPRGYALKIDDEYVREHNLEIERDWGGYGLIAPEFDGA